MDALVGVLMRIDAPQGFSARAVGVLMVLFLSPFFDGVGDFHRLSEGEGEQRGQQESAEELSGPSPDGARRERREGSASRGV